MNNYIILENRAELTTAQVLSGMNFSAIVAGATAMSSDMFGGRSFGTGFMSKGFLAVLIVVGGVAVYKNYLSTHDESSLYGTQSAENENVLIRNKSKGPVLVMETIPPKDNKVVNNMVPNAACQPGNHDPNEGNHLTYNGPYVPLLDADSILASEEKRASRTLTNSVIPNQMVQMPQPVTCGKVSPPVNSLTTSPPFNVNGMTEEPKVFNTTVPFKASPNAKSYLWQPVSFNHNVENASGNFKLDCYGGCDFNYISGLQLDGKNYKGVWMRVTRDKKLKFKLESGLKNISLIRTEGDKCYAIHPVAIGIDGPQWRQKEWTYISNKFKTSGATYQFSDHIDFYLIFEDARAGDKLVIDDFVETLVMEK